MWRLLRSDSISVWKNAEVRRRLNHYYAVMLEERAARYLVVKRTPASPDVFVGEDEELWAEHSRVRETYKRLYLDVSEGETKLGELESPRRSFLDLKIEIANRMLRRCNFCERRCGVDRAEGERGVCGLDSVTRVASAFHHHGEEAPLVPSGTIFFSGCSFRCVFCQNSDISTNPLGGHAVDAKELASIAERLHSGGVRNINYVGGNPDQQLHTILGSLRHMGVSVPLLWNSNMYMTTQSMELLRDVVDIWLPDFKYGSSECARSLSKVEDYFTVVSRNHREAQESGDMIIRHLLLPGHIECCTERVLSWIAENCPRSLVNIMDQYRPEHLVLENPERYPGITRRMFRDELERAFTVAESLGLCYKPVTH